MSDIPYFLDTHALIEVIGGNEKYRRYLSAEPLTSTWNIVELYLAVLRARGEAEAKRQSARFRKIAVEMPADWLFEAIAFKRDPPTLSHADAIGHTAARRLGARLLTGDEAFRRFDGVEFRR